MSYTVPYSFTPGTKARAQEVNANFNAITDYFDTLDSAKADVNLSNLSSQGINVIKNNSSIRNIGEIITSPLPLTDFGLHLLDGTLIKDEGIYKAFVNYIKSLYTNDPTANYFTTEALWQSSVTTYGVCGKFVFTPAEGSTPASVRLPKITGIVESTTDLTALGDLIEQDVKLPNITGTFTQSYTSYNGAPADSGAFYNISNTAHNMCSGNDGTTHRYTGFDASRSSSVYSGNGSNTKIQPQAIKILYYIVVSTTAKTDFQVDIDEIATDLNEKADVDLSNISASQSAKNMIMDWLMPDYDNVIDISSTVTTTSTQTRSYPYPIYLYVMASDINVAGGVIICSIGNETLANSNVSYNGVASLWLIPANTGFTLYYGITPNRSGLAHVIPVKGRS